MNIDRLFSEKDRYQRLREAGFSSSEARKIRRYGQKRFLDELAKKSADSFNSAVNEIKKKEKETGEEILKPLQIPKQTKNQYNYKFKYNYVIRMLIEEEHKKRGRPKKGQKSNVEYTRKINYYTYTSNTKLSQKELQKEMRQMKRNIERKYKKRVIYAEVVSFEVSKD